MKRIPLFPIPLLFGLLLPFLPLAVQAGALANDASILDIHWNQEDPAIWSREAGKDAPAPARDGDALRLSMEGATDGSTWVRKTLTTPMNFVVTSRVAIDRFPSTQGWGSYPHYNGIQLLKVYQDDAIVVQIGPDAIRIASWANDGSGTVISLPTEEGRFYTWQFEITQAEGADAAGTVTIYRREEDSQPWTLVEQDAPLLSADFGDDIPLAVIYHNADDPQSQGVLRQEYFLTGVAKP